MAKVLSSISLDSPASPVSASVDDTFTFAGTPTLSGGGGVQRYDFKWEVNNGGGYVTIGAATGLTTSATNPVTNTNSQAQQSITVTCATAGSYTIRMAGAPTSGGSYTVLSSTQTVTVSAPAITGTGACAAQSSTASGAGVSLSTGTGVLTDASSAVVGSGTAGDASITGTGALSAQAADAAGLGTSLSTGVGVLSGQSSTLDASGTSSSSGNGSLTVSAVVVSGSGVSASTGTGALTLEASTISSGANPFANLRYGDKAVLDMAVDTRDVTRVYYGGAQV